MYQTLIILGIVCILGAAAGGSLKAFGVEIPQLSRPRVVLVFLIGAVLIASGILTRPKPSPEGPYGISVTTDRVGSMTASYCPANLVVYGSLTTAGGQGTVTVRLEEILDNGDTTYSGPLTVSVQGARTTGIQDTTLVHTSIGGDVEWEVVSPVTEGSNTQSFSVTC
jgi:hypothetical protein